MDRISHILPKPRLSRPAKTVIANLWRSAKKQKSHHKHVKPEIHHFVPTRDMPHANITGLMSTTIYNSNTSECRKFHTQIHGHTITAYIVWYEPGVPPDIDDMVYRIVSFLEFIVPMSRTNCSEHVNMYFLLTPHARFMPHEDQSMYADHLHSAYTYSCRRTNELYVYRQEDWFKAFIHECFHTFGLDFSNTNLTKETQRVREAFPGIDNSVQILMYESYTDIWATICACIWKVLLRKTHRQDSRYIHKNGQRNDQRNGQRNRKTRRDSPPISQIMHEIHMQCCFAVFQCVKMLKHQKTTYLALRKPPARYHEDVMVFSYHVIRPCYMSQICRAIEWAAMHNEPEAIMRVSIPAISSFVDIFLDIAASTEWAHALSEAAQALREIEHSRDQTYEEFYILRTARMNI